MPQSAGRRKNIVKSGGKNRLPDRGQEVARSLTEVTKSLTEVAGHSRRSQSLKQVRTTLKEDVHAQQDRDDAQTEESDAHEDSDAQGQSGINSHSSQDHQNVRNTLRSTKSRLRSSFKGNGATTASVSPIEVV